VGVFQSVGSAAVTENVLSDFDAGNAVQMSGGGMSEQFGM
jgi:hypothetical protein